MSATELTYTTVLRELRRHHFAVLSTSDTAGGSASAGVTYGVARPGSPMYIMTRSHLQKARNIAVNSGVSLVVPTPRRMLWGLPPATIQLRGRAQILDSTDPDARSVFAGFWLGRRIMKSYRELEERGEQRVCFLRIELDPVIHTYMIGTSVWQARSNMEAASATVVRP